MKFQWEIDDHHDDQYVTLHDKELNEEFDEFFYRNEFIIHIDFQIKEYFLLDEHFMLYGKPTKNIGLVYKKEENELFFILRTQDKITHNIIIPASKDELSNSISITVIRKNNNIKIYKNLIEVVSYDFVGDICNEYRDTALYLGCSSTLSDVSHYRWYGEMDVDIFFIVKNNSNIKTVKEILTTELNDYPRKKFYNNLLCCYDFQTINNLGIIYDESKNNNYLELIPEDFKL